MRGWSGGMIAMVFAAAMTAVACQRGAKAVHDAAVDAVEEEAGPVDRPPTPQFYLDPFFLCPNADAAAPEAGDGDADTAGVFDASDGDASDGDASDGDASDGGAWSSGCPFAEPAAGPCPVADLRCDYGDPINLRCRRRWLCVAGTWQTTGGCPGQNPPACPSLPDAGVCMNLVDLGCSYPDGELCGCYTVGAQPKCLGTRATAGCPAQVPLQGEDCRLAPGLCSYGDGELGWDAVCCHGTWQVAPYVIVIGI